LFQERYNRIVLPFFFLSELLLLASIYLFTMDISLSNARIDLLVISITWALPSLIFRSYRAPRTHSRVAALRPQAKTMAIFSSLYYGLTIAGFLSFAFINDIIQFLLILMIFQFIYSLFRYEFFHRYRLSGKNIHNVLLISLQAENNVELLKKDGLHFGYHIVERISDINVLEKKLKLIISQKRIDSVFLWETGENISKKVSKICDQYGVRLKLLLNMDPSTGRKAGLDIMGGFPVMDVRKEPLLYLENRIIKRLIDIIMAVFSIIAVLTWLPLIVKIAQMISFPGSLFFIQKRIGRNGKIFKLYKFRTMFESKDSNIAELGKSAKTFENDVRVSWFGRILRQTNLDEYPQFLNVLIGSMSTIGPRPHMLGEDLELENNIDNYRVRRFVKPGITGLAAIKGYRGGTDDLDLMEKRIELDIWYLENWSLWLDIKIIVITIWQMATFRIPKAY
jgi:putative colanic acid biosysnthesis UDP-glucose lipid carrier transferase